MSNQEQPSVYAITSASTGLSFDQAGRKRRYLISMSLRTICFVGAVFAKSTLGINFWSNFSSLYRSCDCKRGTREFLL